MKPTQKPIILVGGLLGLLLVIQLVPYGKDHRNPPTTLTLQWDSPRTEDLARRACYDCHSNETRWPWYAEVAPVSWRVQANVEGGREKLNFSRFDRPQEEAEEAAEAVEKGEMPPLDYMLAHPEARLTLSEKQQLIAGLTKTLGGEDGHQEHEEGQDDD